MDDTHGAASERDRAFQPPATVSLFGHDPVPASVWLFERSRSWRVRRAVVFGVGGLLLAPVVALLPPHAVWFLGAAGTGMFLAWRSYHTRFALSRLDAHCPRCGAALAVSTGTRLRQPHPLSCGSCHHEPTLSVDSAYLP